MKKVLNLRALFIIYLGVKLLADAGLGWSAISDSMLAMHHGRIGSIHLSPDLLLGLVVLGNLLLLALGLWIFHHLLLRRNWARIILLVVGWLAVADALFSVMFSGQASAFLSRLDRGMDWDRLLNLDRLTDILGAVYWGYLIWVLQFDRDVKREFEPPAEEIPKKQNP